MLPNRYEILQAARQVANFAATQGVPSAYVPRRSSYSHVGALLADAILQAGLNYRWVVIPRVNRILQIFPYANRVSFLASLVKEGRSSDFLDWKHPVKILRFEYLIGFLDRENLDAIEDIRDALKSEKFRTELQSLNGIGPKTVDYICCLVGIESIAVDRHIKSFALKAGLSNCDYEFLKLSFCFAADLLSISRREFDAWVWSRESRRREPQLDLVF